MSNVSFYSTGGYGELSAEGKSTYELAVENGFDGTIHEWLQSIKGEDGKGILAVCVDDDGRLLMKVMGGSEDELQINPETGHLERVVDWESGQQIVDLGKVVGASGKDGINGAIGSKGADGITYDWLTGASAPTGTLGKIGDMFLNTITGDIYKKTAVNTWTLQGNIKGVTGATGATGLAATIEVGTVTTGAAGTNTSVINVGTALAAKLNFTIPKGEPGTTNLNMELIFSGDANTVGSSYTVTKAITNFKMLMFRLDFDFSHFGATYKSFPVSDIKYNIVDDLHVWNYYFSNGEMGAMAMNMYFNNSTKFTISVYTKGSGWERFGITKIWGVY